MAYEILFTQRALKDLNKLDRDMRRRIVTKIELLKEGFGGDVKALVNFGYGYRLRIGDYRVLFDVEDRKSPNDNIIVIRFVIVQRVLHRREVYR